MSKGFLLVLSGPSGVGKGTVSHALINKLEELVYSISVTTRSPRSNEVNGENYFFIKKDEFKEMVNNDELLEYAKVHGNYYGTPRQFVKETIEDGKIILLEIDVQGAMQIKKNVEEAVFIFLLPPSMEELKKRIVNRGTESLEDIDLRYKNAYEEIDFVDEYDYFVVNNTVDQAVKDVTRIISAEQMRVCRYNKIKLI